MAEIRDGFISYAHADEAWVKVLAGNLHQSELEVFLDEWEIGPGDVRPPPGRGAAGEERRAGRLAGRAGAPVVQEEYGGRRCPSFESPIILLEIGSPEARIGLHWFSRQRRMPGDGRFREIVGEHLSPENTDRLIDLLDQQDAAEAASATPSERGQAG